jgi:hypothetical protein
MLGSSFAGHVNDACTVLENDAIEFRQPDPAVPEWPSVIGAVMLAVGYQIFMGWVDEGEASATAESGQTEATA